MSRTENCLDPALESFACAGSHVGLCAVDILVCLDDGKGDEEGSGGCRVQAAQSSDGMLVNY